MTDTTLETLRMIQGRKYRLSNDPANYEVLMDPNQLSKLRYASLIEKHQENQVEVSEQIVRGLYGGFAVQNDKALF